MRSRRTPIATKPPTPSKGVSTTAARCPSFTSLSHVALHPMLNNYERPLHFVQHRRKLRSQQRLLRINHHIHRPCRRNPRQPHRFPQPPLHAIAHHRPAQRPPHGKSHARPWGDRLAYGLAPRGLRSRPRQIENSYGRREMPPPLLINPLKIRVAQQSTASRETDLLPPRPRSVRLFLGSDSAHGNRLVEFPDRDILSRKREKEKASRRSQPTSRDNYAQVSSVRPCVPLWLSSCSD